MMRTTDSRKPVLALCGKGGVGKTAVASLLARAMLGAGIRPLLLIDADPSGGLVSAIGEKVSETLAGVREKLIRAAAGAGDAAKSKLADRLDYLVLEALLERQDYSVLAMGFAREKGCFCPANALLREAIDLLAGPFAAVIIDAEAGLEQIHRQVTRRVSNVVVVMDGSQRSVDVARLIRDIVGKDMVCGVTNRVSRNAEQRLPEGIELLGSIPEDDMLRRFDAGGRSLWDLPRDNPAMRAAAEIAEKLFSPAIPKECSAGLQPR
ncbi:MAG: AAA family ATPase [Pseudomonadota bacterium]